ncbi:hypothetical protein ACPCSK_34460 [Streptomyces griseoincarnatus]
MKLVKNFGLDNVATGVDTSTTNEPTAARYLDQVFMTGNDFASYSNDGGANWTHIDPAFEFPFAAGGFCCDQKVLHHLGRNLWIRVLQYATPPGGGSNLIRLAWSTNGTPAPGSWWVHDIIPQLFDPTWQTGIEFDRCDIATTSNHLYITINVFKISTGKFIAALVLKAPLDDLEAHVANYVFYRLDTTFGNRGGLGLTHGATTDMFLMGAETTSPVRIFRWPDAVGSSMSYADVPTTFPWEGSRAKDAYVSTCPNGVTNWLRRSDCRPTAGWVTGNRVGFMWMALQDATHPQPWIKTLIADTSTFTSVSEPDLWSTDIAWAYPAACPNSNGVLGVTLFVGGPTLNPRHAVGFRDGDQWRFQSTRDSTHAPTASPWGDYLSCATHHPFATDEWVASGYTLQGGTDGKWVEPQYVQFRVGP